jgi:hypothetical protein
MPLGQAMVAPVPGPDRVIRVWLDRKFVDRLGEIGSPGESYSDVILRMARDVVTAISSWTSSPQFY